MRFGQSVLFILIIYSLLSLPCPLSFPHYIFLPLVTTVDAEYSDENTKKGQILPIFASKDKYLNVNFCVHFLTRCSYFTAQAVSSNWFNRQFLCSCHLSRVVLVCFGVFV